MDKKYNIKRSEVRQGQSDVSTESCLEDTVKNLQTGCNSFDNSKCEADKILKVALLQIEVGNKVTSYTFSDIRQRF